VEYQNPDDDCQPQYRFSGLPVIASLIERAFDLILPSCCAVCAAPGHDDLALCLRCHARLPRPGNGCAVCARPLENEGPLICGRCQQAPPHYDRTIALLQYKEPVDHLIIGLKFSARLAHARLLSTLFMDTLDDETKPELLIPMPLHRQRLRERGFNQSMELARLISKQTGIPIDANSCSRTRNTEPQSTLSAKGKEKNVKNAFAVIQPIKAKHVAIVDDVMTSGHTVNELARTLKRAGISRVDVWVMARAAKS